MKLRLGNWIGLSAIVVLVDQWTKHLVRGALRNGEVIRVTDFFDLVLAFNPGAAFSMGEDFTVVLTLVSVAALAGVLAWVLPRTRHVGWTVGMGLLLAGILGNLTDRLIRPPAPLHGHVIDFFQVPNFAIFNVADICITFAAITIIWLVVITQVDLNGTSTKEEKAVDAPVAAPEGDA